LDATNISLLGLMELSLNFEWEGVHI